ncbi:MAG: molybdopterin dehydrogenase [Flexilinea flocculi]|jgi:xanthine dehydrogenase FAD-binding subunit|nr:molybdopterin dehydrogenase [Flexilinea flocculi]
MVTFSNGYLVDNLADALKIRSEIDVTPYAGGTDLMVDAKEDAVYLFLNKIPELRRIYSDEQYLHIGAACTYTEIFENSLSPQILKDAIDYLAAPAIRNMGTAGGNICNASPKADTALIFYVADAKLRICNTSGERILPIEDFYVGRGKTVLQKDELLVEILVPKQGLEHYYYKKVGARQALAISRVAFAGIFTTENGIITRCAMAFGSVADTVLRFRDLEALFVGKSIAEAKSLRSQFIANYEQAIVPIRGRVSAEYRKSVCMNLLEDFLTQNGI